MNLLQRISSWRYRRGIEQALALGGAARGDGLTLHAVSSRLEIEWRARSIHPWDRNDAWDRRARPFVSQTLNDTEKVIQRLFRTLPHLDAIGVTVLDHETEQVIVLGTVRSIASAIETERSQGMRLKQLGLRFHTDGLRFEPLHSPEPEEISV